MAEVAGQLGDTATSVVVSEVLSNGSTEYRARLPVVDLWDEEALSARFGPGAFKLRYLDEGGKFKHSLDVRIAGERRPAAPPASPPAPGRPAGDLDALRAQVEALTALVRAQAPAPAAPAAVPPTAAPLVPGLPSGDVSGLSGIMALAAAMSAPANRMTEALLPLLTQTIKPPDRDPATHATETLLRGIELGRTLEAGRPLPAAGDPDGDGYMGVIREVGVPLVNLLSHKLGVSPPAPAAPVPEGEPSDPAVAQLVVHARTIAARCAGLGPAEAAELVDRVAREAVDGPVPGHEGVTYRELLTDPAVRAEVGRWVPDVRERAGWWEAFGLALWDLGSDPESAPGEGGPDGSPE